MAGIYGAFLKNKPIIDKTFDFFNKDLITDELKTDNGILGRSVLPKLLHDRFLVTRNTITICFEGVNLSDNLKTQDDFFEAYNQKGINFIKSLKGNFSGFVYDDNRKKVYVFNDHLSTKNIFYYYEKEIGFVFCSKLFELSKFLRTQEISYSLNEDAVYMMALYGFLLEDHTYLKEVKKLPYSSLITYDIEKDELQIEKLFTYKKQSKSISYADTLHQLNDHFENSVVRNWGKDADYKANHLTLLSGGMDARTNVMVAKDLGFDNISSITFGQSQSKDIAYAKKIALGEGLDPFLRFLDNPDYLMDNIIENYIIPNDGLMMFHSSSHMSSTVRRFNINPYQILHSGQLGDTLMGSFTKRAYDFRRNRGAIGYTGFVSDDGLLDRIETLPEILDKYQDLGYELYTYEQRQINATLVGDRSLNNTIDTISPFFNLELINLCLSLPDNVKTNQMLYYDWLKKYHPRILNYRWDKIELKPNRKYKIFFGRNFKKYYNGAKKYFGWKYDSMNPYNQWLKEDPKIIRTMDSILEAELEKSYISKQMKKDLQKIYANDIFEFRNKFAVITAVLAMNLYFSHGE